MPARTHPEPHLVQDVRIGDLIPQPPCHTHMRLWGVEPGVGGCPHNLSPQGPQDIHLQRTGRLHPRARPLVLGGGRVPGHRPLPCATCATCRPTFSMLIFSGITMMQR